MDRVHPRSIADQRGGGLEAACRRHHGVISTSLRQPSCLPLRRISRHFSRVPRNLVLRTAEYSARAGKSPHRGIGTYRAARWNPDKAGGTSIEGPQRMEVIVNLHHIAILAAFISLVVDVQPSIWRIEQAPPAMQSVIARADLVIASLQDSVLRELTSALAHGGPELAVQSCHLDTTLTTQRFGREGIAAGRTSDRLRSPTNRAPKWASETVRTYAGQSVKGIDGFVIDLGDRIGVLRPIAEREICAQCHGPVERLKPQVREVLSDRYPADRAIGFHEGEIRGWFWVEMPKPGGSDQTR
jgi:hypothetical protein